MNAALANCSYKTWKQGLAALKNRRYPDIRYGLPRLSDDRQSGPFRRRTAVSFPASAERWRRRARTWSSMTSGSWNSMIRALARCCAWPLRRRLCREQSYPLVLFMHDAVLNDDADHAVQGWARSPGRVRRIDGAPRSSCWPAIWRNHCRDSRCSDMLDTTIDLWMPGGRIQHRQNRLYATGQSGSYDVVAMNIKYRIFQLPFWVPASGTRRW